MRVEYRCGLVHHSEWICFQHLGYARQKASAWWQQRSAAPVPATVAEALDAADSLATPTAILVRPRGRFTEIVNCRFDPCTDPASAPSVAASPVASAGSMHAIASATRRRDTSQRGLCSRPLPGPLPSEDRHDRPNTPRTGRACCTCGEMAGEYLDSLRRTDLAQLSVEEWHTLIEVIVTGYCDHLRALAGEDRSRTRCLDAGGAVLSDAPSFMARFGARLVANGYSIVPIQPGTKKPGRYRDGRLARLSGLDPARRPRHDRAGAPGMEPLARGRRRHRGGQRRWRRHRHRR